MLQQIEVLAIERSQIVEEEMVLLECVQVAHSIHVNSFSRHGPGSLAGVARTITMFVLDLLKGYNVEMQQNIMHKVVSQLKKL